MISSDDRMIVSKTNKSIPLSLPRKKFNDSLMTFEILVSGYKIYCRMIDKESFDSISSSLPRFTSQRQRKIVRRTLTENDPLGKLTEELSNILSSYVTTHVINYFSNQS